MVNISIGTAALTAVLGYATVFLGIVFLMVVIHIMGTVFKKRAQKNKVTDLGSISAPSGMDPKAVAAIAAVIAELEGEE